MATYPLSGAIRRLLIAQVPADFADWLDFVAIGALLAYGWQADPMVFAILAVSFGLPYLIIGPLAGVLVDQVNLNLVLVVSNLGRAVMTGALCLVPSWEVLMILVGLRATADTFYTPAKQAAIQALTMPEQRMRANGLSHVINQSSKVVAPAIGGGLLIWLDPQQVFLFNALVSVVAALLLASLPPILRDVSADAEKRSLWGNIRAGLDDVRRKPILRAALTMMGMGYFAMFFYDTLIAPLTRDLGFTQATLGLSLAAVGAGGVLGAVILGMRDTGVRPFVLVAGGAGIGAVVIITLGLVETRGIPLNMLVFVGLFGLLGVASAMSVVPFRTILPNEVAPERIGRVTALSEALNTIALLTAPFIGAAIAAMFSVGAAFICGGGVLLMVSFQAWRLRHHR